MALEIIKLSNKRWKHNGILLSSFYIKANDTGDLLNVFAPNGQKPISSFAVADITLIDQTQDPVVTYPTFASIQLLVAELETLNYAGFPSDGGVVGSLNDLSDVTITSPSAGQVVIRNALNTGWINGTILSFATPILIAGIKASESLASANPYKAQWAVRNLGFSTNGHASDTWLCNATTNQRLVFRFGRTVDLRTIVIKNYFNNSSGNNEMVTGTGNAGINNCVIYGITGNESNVTNTYNANLSELQSVYSGAIPITMNSSQIFKPSFTNVSCDGVVIDIIDNHGSPSNIGLRKIWFYGI